MGFRKLENDALTVTGGTVTSASRLLKWSNAGWRIRVQPDSDAVVTVLLPATTDCGASGAICTADERKLSNRTELTVQGLRKLRNPRRTPAHGLARHQRDGPGGRGAGGGHLRHRRPRRHEHRDVRLPVACRRSDISGATGPSHTLTSSEQGQTIQVRVSFTDDRSNDETLTSAATATVAARPNSPPTGLPTISGTAQVGETLEADTSDIDDADSMTNATFSYQWVADDSDISDATGSTYTLVNADEGKAIQVRVSFTDDRGNEESLTSETTAAVAPMPVWSATLTVGANGEHLGFRVFSTNSYGSLSSTTFALDGVSDMCRF